MLWLLIASEIFEGMFKYIFADRHLFTPAAPRSGQIMASIQWIGRPELIPEFTNPSHTEITHPQTRGDRQPPVYVCDR
jgi:hypothetical protein